MKFGVLQFFSWPDRRVDLRTVYDRAFQRIDTMDRTGYDAVWLAEHHFSNYSICPSVHMMATHIAAHTKNLRIGTAISLAAFYHPLRLAEEVALLDVLTEGRVNWGAGRGFDPKEFAMFGVDPKDSAARFHEAVEIVQAAWGNERMTHHGDYWDFDDVEVLPKPHQQPHPPMWMAASSESAIEWSAQKGYNILMDPHSSFVKLDEKIKLYHALLEANGHSTDNRDIPVARLLAIGDTQGEAETIARAGAQWMAGGYMKLSAKTSQGNPDAAFGINEGDDPVERYVRDVVIHGTPESVTEKIEQLRDESNLNYLLCAPLSHSSFVSFTEDVLPKFL